MKKIAIFSAAILVVLAGTWGIVQMLGSSSDELREITLYGNVDIRQVDISFQVPGLVTQLLFEEGDRVQKGEVMAVLDSTGYDHQLAEAQAAAEAIGVHLVNSQKLLQRRQELIGVGSVSQEELQNIAATCDQLRANHVEAHAAISVAQDRVQYTKAYAPVDGVVLTRIREPGSVVNLGNPVYTLSVDAPVWIRAFIDEEHLGEIYPGMEAEIFTDSNHHYTGSIGFISPVAEFTPRTVETPQLRTALVYRLRICIPDSDRFLRQGMPVTVKLARK